MNLNPMKAITKHLILTAGLLFGGLAAIVPQAHATGGVPLWTNFYNGSGTFGAVAERVAVDHSGNVFVTGYSYSGGDFASSDFATVAYSNTGAPLWTNLYNGPGNDHDEARAIALDSGGNVFVAGT